MEYFFLMKQFRKQKFTVPNQVVPRWFWLMGLGFGWGFFPFGFFLGFFFPFLITDTFETLHETVREGKNTGQ